MRICFLLIITFFIFIIISSNSASCFQILKPEDNISSDVLINDDLYIVDDDILIQFTVLGDVLFLGRQVEISGNVTGDVMAGAGTVIINGNVGDDIRIAAYTLILNGNVNDDLLISADKIIISDNAQIGGDLVFIADQMELKGDVGGNIYGEGNNVTIGGHVGGDVDLAVDNLNILTIANINGNFTYSSPQEASIKSGIVERDINFIKKELTKEEDGLVKSIIWWLVRYLFLLIIGFFILFLMPNQTKNISYAIPISPFQNFIIGLILVIIGLTVPFLIFITVVGAPLGIILLLVTIIILYVARIFFSIWLGRVVFSILGKKSKPWMDIIVGVFLLFILTNLPLIGFGIYLITTFISIGAFFIIEKKNYTELKEKNIL